MKSYSIAIRIKEGSDLDRVYKSWTKTHKWSQSQFLENAIRELTDLEPVYKDSMEQETLQRLASLVNHLDTIATRLEQGGVLSAAEGTQVRQALENEMPDQIRAALKKMKREPIRG